MDRELAELIERLETELLQPEVRRSPDRISELLADDFIEFGISGKRYTKQDMLRFLPQSEGPDYQATDFEARQMASDVVLLTYRAAIRTHDTGKITWSWRSSLWQRRNNEWQLFFHQGTPQADRA